jgi:hypothetical protein
MKVICINDANKPAKIPLNEWVKEGTIYTVTEVVNMGLQPGKFGYLLKEVSLSKESFPYEYYSADRFGVLVDQSLENVVEQEELVEEELSI